MTKSILTQSELKEQIHYDPETGIFTRLKNNLINIGTIQKSGHIRFMVNGNKYLSHRLAWLYVHGEFPFDEIDHINGIPSDNRISNLRVCTHSQNMKNRKVYVNNKSGLVGVYFDKLKNKWRSQCALNGRRFSLGLFETKELAYEARQLFVKNNFGEFARQ